MLFLGYSMRDWNLRVILRQIWAEQGSAPAAGRSSSLRARSTPVLGAQRVEILDVALEDWVDAMREQLA